MAAPLLNPRNLDPAGMEALSPILFEEWAPYTAYAGRIPRHALQDFCNRRFQRLREQADYACSTSASAGLTPGFAALRNLEWDSGLFGFAAARLEALVAAGTYAERAKTKAALLEDILRVCGKANLRHLTARVPAADLSATHALEAEGFELLDGIQTFSRSAGDWRPGPHSAEVSVRPFETADMEEVLGIARSSYIYDRFHADAALSEETAQRVAEEWTRNSCLGTAAAAVLVAIKNGHVTGYITCSADEEARTILGAGIGSIGLVATSMASRGCGVAHALSAAAIEWFRGKGVEIVEVGTQLRNIPAARLYESCGFRLISVSLTFRKRW